MFVFCSSHTGTQQEPEFVYVPLAMSWTNAQKYCREKFTDLATVRSDAENQAMHAMVLSPYLWFGLHIDPNSYWSDWSNSSFRHWEGASLPVGSMSVVCGVAALQNSGKWKFLQCETRLPFVCYSVPPLPGEQFLRGGITTFTQVTDQSLCFTTGMNRTKTTAKSHLVFLSSFCVSTTVTRQIVKLRIKRGDSSVDLNDPAVKADILKQVRLQNLPQHNFIHPRQMQSNHKKCAFLCLFVLLCVLPKGKNNVVGV